jgi:tRNA-dihydrouridine synthase
VILNGGIKTAAQVREWLPRFDGLMLGRQIYHEPYLLAELDAQFLGPGFVPPPREDVVERYADYVEAMLAEGHRLPLMLRHIQGLFAGLPMLAPGVAISPSTRSCQVRVRKSCGIRCRCSVQRLTVRRRRRCRQGAAGTPAIM